MLIHKHMEKKTYFKKKCRITIKKIKTLILI